MNSEMSTFNLDINGVIKKDGPISRANRQEASAAGIFLDNSGISDAIIDFRNGFLGGEGELSRIIEGERQEVSLVNQKEFSSKSKLAGVSIILEWRIVDSPNTYVFSVKALRDDLGERFLSASFVEKNEQGLPYSHRISRHYFPEGFKYSTELSDKDKEFYQSWAREVILDFGLMWGQED